MIGTERRETFIALKARKEGYLIASDLLNPHMEVPPELRQPVPAERIDPFEGQITYQPDYRGVYDPSESEIHYVAFPPPSLPRWIWPLLVLEVLALGAAVVLVALRLLR